MDIKIQSLHFDADKKLIDFINNKVKKLLQIADNIIDAEVVLKIDKSDVNDNKVVEITVNIPKISGIFAKKSGKSFEEAITDVCEALKNQIKREKEKQRE